MNISQVIRSTRKVLALIDNYSTDPKKKREMIQDPLLLGFFEARFGKMSRQKKIWIGPGTHPKRVDFRHGGANPVLIEFAVRPPSGDSELYESQNSDEINKLTRFSQSKAKIRILLLIDLKIKPIRLEKLEETYKKVKSTPGKYTRYPVRIIYVHKSIDYSFKWGN